MQVDLLFSYARQRWWLVWFFGPRCVGLCQYSGPNQLHQADSLGPLARRLSVRTRRAHREAAGWTRSIAI